MKDHEFHEHFPDDATPKLLDYITNTVMDWSRYLFTHREGRRQWAYCTNCRQEHPTDRTLKHGKEEQCPHCGCSATVKASGVGRKTLVDRAYLLWYERSQVDSNILIARGFYCTRDYTKDYRKTETYVKDIARYLFKWGEGGKMKHRIHWTKGGEWYDQKKVSTEATKSMSYTPSYHMQQKDIKKVVKGTPFQYCTWDQYPMHDYVEIFDLAARYSCIEFLTKFGLGHFVRTKLEGGQTFGAINWNGTTPQKVLRLNKREMNEIKKTGAIGLQALRHYQICRKDGSNLSFTEARDLASLVDPLRRAELAGILTSLDNRFTVAEMKRYFIKQIRNNRFRYEWRSSVILDYRDYLRECRELGLDLNRNGVVMPNDLGRMHEFTMQRIKAVSDAVVRENIRTRFRSLKPMRFQYKDLILFPAPSADQLVSEGKTLSHCVGGYAKNYANGVCDIYFIRQKHQPDKPFYTMEVQKGAVMQCRGFKNCIMTDEVKEFVEMFEERRLKKRPASPIKKSNKPQGVAV
ncbi:PcfJ domain-containing protein [Paenibacillus monticola]|uniref:PcfJ-like protein n=1 Tax=Paenibacillus monticola TaxID=2666075 RepID=A0A7X2H1S0_9BACL|nr:PcfJ domain-containing protein [Paenibacillus monticola]MRN51964.1 hypothetical protein [Paenibacillus monticola]